MLERAGVTPLSKLETCWEAQLDKRWWLAINPTVAALACSKGVTVPAFTVYLEWNGWPAGFIHPRDGGVIADGSLANISSFTAACDAYPGVTQ